MDQHWEFVNIDKRQTTGHLGKMGELFFSKSPRELFYFFATPTVPLKNASSDPTTKKEVAGAWAGDHIICLGYYAESLPDGVVSDADFPETASNVKYHSAAFTESCKTARIIGFGEKKEAACS